MNHSSIAWKLYIDGASRGNPGPSGAGFCLYKNEQLVLNDGFFLNSCTNNKAEYMALVIGLFFCVPYFSHYDTLIIISDSQLLVEQMKKNYKINNPVLKELHTLALALLLNSKVIYTFQHILRAGNMAADAMANKGVDDKKSLTFDCCSFLKRYGIYV